MLLEGLISISRSLGSALAKKSMHRMESPNIPIPVHLWVGNPKGLTLTPNFDCLDLKLSFMKNFQNVVLATDHPLLDGVGCDGSHEHPAILRVKLKRDHFYSGMFALE